VGGFRQAEIENLDAAFARHQNVVRLQVAVNDTGGVRSGQTIADLHRDVEQFARGIGRRDRCAFDELHHQIVRAHIVKLADVGMIQGGDRAGLALKAFAEFFVSGLDGDDAVQPRIARFPPLPPAPCRRRRGAYGPSFWPADSAICVILSSVSDRMADCCWIAAHGCLAILGISSPVNTAPSRSRLGNSR
jgi:hypothetical protein